MQKVNEKAKALVKKRAERQAEVMRALESKGPGRDAARKKATDSLHALATKRPKKKKT
jgi:hypothetical protein